MNRFVVLFLSLGGALSALAAETVDEHLDELRERYEALGDFFAYYRATNAEQTMVEIALVEIRSAGAAGARMTHGGSTSAFWTDGEKAETRALFAGSLAEPALIQGFIELTEVFASFVSVFAEGEEAPGDRVGVFRQTPVVTLGMEDLSVELSGPGIGGIRWDAANKARVDLIEADEKQVRFVFGANEWMSFDRTTGMLVEHVIETPEGRRRVWLEDFLPGKDRAAFRREFPLPDLEKVERLPIGTAPNVATFHAMAFDMVLADARAHGVKAEELGTRISGKRTWLHDYWRVFVIHSFREGFWVARHVHMLGELRKLYERKRTDDAGEFSEIAFAAWLGEGVPLVRRTVLAADDWREDSPWLDEVRVALAPSLHKVPPEQAELGEALVESMLRTLYEAVVDESLAPFGPPAK